MKNNIIISCVCLLVGMMSGCTSVTDTPPDPGFNPDALVALGEKSISVWDLIGESIPDESGSTEEMRVTLQYLQEKALTLPALAIYNITADTLFYAPYFQIDAAVVGGTFGVPLSKAITLDRADSMDLTTIPLGVKIKHMEDVADFEYVFPYTGFEYEVSITLKNIFLRGTTIPMVIKEKVDKDNQKGVRRKVNASFDIDLSKGNRLWMETQITISKGSVLFEPQTIALFVKSLNMKLEKAVGYFPVPPMQLDSNNLKMNLDVLSDLSNAFDMSDPKYYLIVRNKGFGLPADVKDLSLNATNATATKSVSLKTDEEMSFEANLQNVLRVDTFAFTPGNSNLIEFLNLPPHGNINYNGTIRFNPAGNTGEDNIIYADGVSQVDSYIEIPLVMKGSSLMFRDTLKNLVVDKKQLSVAQLTVTSKTDIPFTMNLRELVFYDANGDVLGKVEFNEQLTNAKALVKTVGAELLSRLADAKYGVATMLVYPSLDVLSIRQDAALKINYSLLGETKDQIEK